VGSRTLITKRAEQKPASRDRERQGLGLKGVQERSHTQYKKEHRGKSLNKGGKWGGKKQGS